MGFIIIIVIVIVIFIFTKSGSNNSSKVSNNSSTKPSYEQKTYTANTNAYSSCQHSNTTQPHYQSVNSYSKPSSLNGCINKLNPEMLAMKNKILEKYKVVEKTSYSTKSIVNGHEIKFIDSAHKYYVDGKQVPSVTEIIKNNGYNPTSYSTINPAVLQRAAMKGTHMHNVIEAYELKGIESYEPELAGYKRLKTEYNIKPLVSEIMLAIFDDDNNPVCAGRLDFVIFNDDTSVNIIDLKRTSSYHADTVSRQLNLYRIGFMQCYGISVKKLACLRLREYVAEYHPVSVNKNTAYEVLYDETGNDCFLLN